LTHITYDYKLCQFICFEKYNVNPKDTVECYFCKEKGLVMNMNVHHIIPRSKNYSLVYEPSNLVLGHKWCHEAFHAKQKKKKKKKKNKKRNWYHSKLFRC